MVHSWGQALFQVNNKVTSDFIVESGQVHPQVCFSSMLFTTKYCLSK